MEITFYNTKDAPNVVNKSLTFIKGFNNLPLKQDMDILEPNFFMVFGTEYIDIINYMYIADLGRYYHCKCKLITGGRVEVSGKIDVLKTWLANATGNVYVKKQSAYSPYLKQDIPTYANSLITTKKFSSIFTLSPQRYLLGVLGGN